MIKLLSIRDFKCFERADVNLGSLTLLTGFNAAGKSTVLQSLLLLSQGLRSSLSKQHLPLNGALVRLGTAGDVIRRGSDGEIAFHVSGFDADLEWSFSDADRDLLDEPIHGERLKIVNSPPESSSLKDDQKFLQEAVRDLVFLGATRHGRQDVFPSSDDADPVNADVGSEGQFAPWLYVRNADSPVEEEKRFPNDESVTFRAQVDAWLGYLFPGASANAASISGTSYSRLEFRLGRSSAWSRPANIGYGLSYAFPLVVALLSAHKGQVVVIDSPEAHLHPRAQSRMGEMLAQFANAGVQVLVETHSDHVLSGARLAVQKKALEAEDLALHFFSGAQEGHGNGIVSPTIHSDGRLSDWPEGFFDQAEIDLMALASH